jgi:hypothetical protein
MGDLLYTDHLVDVDPQKLVLLVLQLQPQGPDLPIRIAHRYHIHPLIALHGRHLLDRLF